MDVNRACMTKLNWQILVEPKKPKYLGGKKLWDLGNKPSTSWVWSGIWSCKDFFSKHTCFKIGWKSKASIWYHLSIPTTQDHRVYGLDTDRGTFTKVARLIDEYLKVWNLDTLNLLFPPPKYKKL